MGFGTCRRPQGGWVVQITGATTRALEVRAPALRLIALGELDANEHLVDQAVVLLQAFLGFPILHRDSSHAHQRLWSEKSCRVRGLLVVWTTNNLTSYRPSKYFTAFGCMFL